MPWKHFSIEHTSTVIGNRNGLDVPVNLTLGRVSTGRSRVDCGCYCLYRNGDEEHCIEASSYYAAVWKLAMFMKNKGVELRIYGLHEHFYQSGLSAETKFGYVDGRIVVMIDPIACSDSTE